MLHFGLSVSVQRPVRLSLLSSGLRMLVGVLLITLRSQPKLM